jgi:hypothetical protein
MAHDVLEMGGAMTLVLGPLLRPHVHQIGNEARAHAGRNMHVEGQCRGRAVPPEFGGHQCVGREVGVQAVIGTRHAQGQQAGLAQVVEAVEREAGFAVMARGMPRQAGAAQLGGAVDQLTLRRRQAVGPAGDMRRQVA